MVNFSLTMQVLNFQVLTRGFLVYFTFEQLGPGPQRRLSYS